SDLLPLDLLSKALPPPGHVRMVQSKGSRGLRLASAVAAPLNFPASQIFTNCYYFPSEFSLVATVKIQTLRQKTNEYIFSVVREGSDSLLLGLRVSKNHRPPCSRPEQGQLWFNAQGKGLFICDGLTWRTLLQSKQRLDYVEDYQDLYTRSETLDVEVFSIPSEGLFMAAANKDSRSGSGIYRWTNASFQLYQNISTQEARSWKHFTIDDKIFLVVAANFREAGSERSVIYQWHRRRRRFVRYQTLETHTAQDWEAFRIHNHSFLVVANHRRDSNHNIHSVIYRWNPDTKLFEVNQTLLTSGAYDWEFFTVGPYHFLVVANTFDGRTTIISSTIYVWLDGSFQTFQSIQVSVCLSFRVSPPSAFVNLLPSWSEMLHQRGRNQSSVINACVRGGFQLRAEEDFYSQVTSVCDFRWQGYEGFVPVHSLPTFGCRDWEDFSTDEGSFLIYSSAKSRLSKVFKLRNY
uniref:Thrombospondin-type laminin G domain and EAR repeats b n=1 Tax=Neolamprologus brichardi TaxID=32507 RepID=A0A3Q4I266_NEOBR